METSAGGVQREPGKGTIPLDSSSKILGLTVFASALLNFFPLCLKYTSPDALQARPPETETVSPVEALPKVSQTDNGIDATNGPHLEEDLEKTGGKATEGSPSRIGVGIEPLQDDVDHNNLQSTVPMAPVARQEKTIHRRQDRHFSPPRAKQVAVLTRSALKRQLQERSILPHSESEDCQRVNRIEDQSRKTRSQRTSRGSQMAHLVTTKFPKKQKMMQDDKGSGDELGLSKAAEDGAEQQDVDMNTPIVGNGNGNGNTPTDAEQTPLSSVPNFESERESIAAACTLQSEKVEDAAGMTPPEKLSLPYPTTGFDNEVHTPAGSKICVNEQDAERQVGSGSFQPLPRLTLQDDESPSISPTIPGLYLPNSSNGNNTLNGIAMVMRTPLASDESPQTARRLLENEEELANAGVRRVRFCVMDKEDCREDKSRAKISRRRSARAPKLRLSFRRSFPRNQLSSNPDLNQEGEGNGSGNGDGGDRDDDGDLRLLKLISNGEMDSDRQENRGSPVVIARRLHQTTGSHKGRCTGRGPIGDETIDGVPQCLREAYLNAKLADCWRHGDSWARLNLSGVEICQDDDVDEVLRKVMTSVMNQRGELVLDMALKALQVEWEHLKGLRQRYVGSPAVDGGPKSILRYGSKFNQQTPPLVSHRTLDANEPADVDIVPNDMHLNVSPPEWQQHSSMDELQPLNSNPVNGNGPGRTRSRGIKMIASINDLRNSFANVDNCGLKQTCDPSPHQVKRARKEVQSKITTRGQRLLRALKASHEKSLACA